MTEIAFYHNTADKVATACRLAADLYAAGRRVVLYARDDRIAAAADRLLWLQPATSFIPHVRAGSPLMSRRVAVRRPGAAAPERASPSRVGRWTCGVGTPSSSTTPRTARVARQA